MSPDLRAWIPAAILLAGAVLSTGGVREQLRMPLRAPLAASVPTVMNGYRATDLPISEEEQRVAGMSSFVLRQYDSPEPSKSAPFFSVYVGYYERQTEGKTIHSPKNCLPGGGWEPLVSSREEIRTALGTVPVNKYLIQNGAAQAMVLYWYQGRGRVQANEYTVKWDLLRDQALHRRSDEALVRVIVPVTETGADDAYRHAVRVAEELVPAVNGALPG